MSKNNSFYKAVTVGLVSVVLLAGCASAKKAPGTAEAAPAPAPAPAAAPTPAAPPADDMHVVVSGEHLWGISSYGNIYNDPYQWPLIFKRNRDQIEDADLIYAGQKLKIQRDLTEDQVQQAIMHAKTRGAWSIGTTEQSDMDYLSKAF